MSDAAFDALFTADRPIILDFHDYPWLIHRLTYRRANHHNLHVRGYKKEGTTATPFDMCVLIQIDRFGLVKDVIRRVPGPTGRAGPVTRAMDEKLAAHTAYIREHGVDQREIVRWRWGGPGSRPPSLAAADTGADNR